MFQTEKYTYTHSENHRNHQHKYDCRQAGKKQMIYPKKRQPLAQVHRRKVQHVLLFLLYTYDSKKYDLV